MSNKWAKPVSEENTETKKDNRTPFRKTKDIFMGLIVAVSLPVSILLICLLLSAATRNPDSGLSQSITRLREIVNALTDVTDDPNKSDLEEALDSMCRDCPRKKD